MLPFTALAIVALDVRLTIHPASANFLVYWTITVSSAVWFKLPDLAVTVAV
jgi:hypothetical protein